MTGDGVGERLVTVLLTLAVPEVADPEDAAALVADAAATTALEVRHASGWRDTYRRRARPWCGRGDGSRGRSWRSPLTRCGCGT